MIRTDGELIEKQLGLNIEKGETPQVLVPKDYIFGSAMNNEGFSLVGCMVAPGFDFKDFELFERKDLLEKYPNYREVIEKLTRQKNFYKNKKLTNLLKELPYFFKNYL